MKKLILIFLMILINTENIYASQQDTADKLVENINLNEMETVINSGENIADVDVNDIFLKAVKGELDISFSGILKEIGKAAFSDFYENIHLLRNLLIIAVLSAFIKALTDSFQNKAIGEMGFYACYISMILVLISSFTSASYILKNLIQTVISFVNAGVPAFTAVIVMNGNFTGAYVLSSILIFAAGLFSKIIANVIVPVIMACGALNVVNYLSENGTLSNFSNLLKEGIVKSIKYISVILVSIVSIQKISTPILNNIALKTAKSTVNVIPVVGEILSGAVENVMYWAKACQSGVLIVVIIAMVIICAKPIIELIVLSFIYRLAAALIQPICDKRIINCLNSIGEYIGLMVSTATIISLMFLISVLIMLSF